MQQLRVRFGLFMGRILRVVEYRFEALQLSFPRAELRLVELRNLVYKLLNLEVLHILNAADADLDASHSVAIPLQLANLEEVVYTPLALLRRGFDQSEDVTLADVRAVKEILRVQPDLLSN
jgi:hypothetical protein